MSDVIGITGGIATGKSTVSRIVKRLGYPVVDADQIAREVVEPHSTGLKQVINAFGSNILTPDGQLNRQKLGEIVFEDPQQLHRLNQIMQPLIRQRIVAKLTQSNSGLVFLDAPLLYEQQYETLCDEVIVVNTSPDLQLQRLMDRDGLTRTMAQARIDSQMPMKEKVKRADVVINNNGTPAQTERQVMEWLRKVNNS